jgi:hypothetical protein
VKFEAILMDNQVGFISRSSVEVFTQDYGEDMLNVVHVHINDMSDSVPIEVIYMQDYETLEDYKKFGVDATG